MQVDLKEGVPFSRCSKLIRKSIIIRNLKYSYEKATYEEDFNIIAPCLMDAKAISMLKVEEQRIVIEKLKVLCFMDMIVICLIQYIIYIQYC